MNSYIRRCDICDAVFEAPQVTGRPSLRCGDACRQQARRNKHRRYMHGLIAARRQLAALAA